MRFLVLRVEDLTVTAANEAGYDPDGDPIVFSLHADYQQPSGRVAKGVRR